MRVLIDNVNGDPWRHLAGEDTSGQNLFVRQVALGLAQRGHQVDVATRLTAPADKLLTEITSNLRLFRIAAGPAVYTYRDSTERFLGEYLARLSSLLDTQGLRYDVAHGNYWLSAAIVRELKKRGYADSLIYTPHSLGRLKAGAVGISNMVRDRIESEILKYADAIHAISGEDAKSICMLYDGVENVVRVPHGVDHKVFCYTAKAQARERLGWDSDKMVLLFVGRFEVQKNLPAALRVYDELSDNCIKPSGNIELVICGGPTRGVPARGDLPNSVLAVMDMLRHSEGVRFVGRIPNNDLRWYYAAADVLICCSVYEPFGLVVGECLSCGTPVAASAVGGLKETIETGLDGYLSVLGDEDALRLNTRSLLARQWQNEDNRKRIADRALRLSWDRCVDSIEELYMSVRRQGVPT